jgi:hypothetical protein
MINGRDPVCLSEWFSTKSWERFSEYAAAITLVVNGISLHCDCDHTSVSAVSAASAANHAQ